MNKQTKKHSFTVRLWQEGDWIIAQCVEIDIASQGKTEQEALDNLREALELHFEPPCATITQQIRTLEVFLNAA
ncbi:MAG: type II toxin-antitoxin system HicB family antitoxin [Candidatus Parabeggiatoa sp.]|nr:type II toxin-antitoxin system HicB family antitoxin [Candidatus Parabeggiatoa sp.]